MNKRLNNRAFTLIEVLVAVGLLMVAAVSIGAIIINTRNNTTKRLSEADLQQRITEIKDTMHNELISTNLGINYWIKEEGQSGYQLYRGDSQLISEETNEKVGADEKIVSFYNFDRESNEIIKTYYKWNSELEELSVATEKVSTESEDGKSTTIDENIADVLDLLKWSLVADKVNNFEMELGVNKAADRLASFKVNIGQDNIDYPATDTVYIRNDIKINAVDHVVDHYVVETVKIPNLKTVEFDYDGERHSVEEEETLNERYIERARESVLSATDVGSYTVIYRLKNPLKYKWENGSSGDICLTWTIGSKLAIIQWGETSKKYDGTTITPVYRIIDSEGHDIPDITLNFSSELLDGTDEINKNAPLSFGPNVGRWKCCASLPESSDNYTLSEESKECEISIVSRPCTATVTLADNLVYDGESKNLVEEATVPLGDIFYAVVEYGAAAPSRSGFTSRCEATNSGKYDVYYYIESPEDPNYEDSGINFAGTVIITSEQRASVEPIGATIIYDGNEHSVTEAYNSDGINWIEDVGSKTSAIDAGTYTVYATPKENYCWPDGSDTSCVPYTWTIEKADGRIDWIDSTQEVQLEPILATNLKTIRNSKGELQKQPLLATYARITGYREDDHSDCYVEYSVNNGSWSRNEPTGDKKGVYSVRYRFVGNKNYNNSEPIFIDSVEIMSCLNEEQVDIEALHPTYNSGQELALVKINNDNGYDIEFSFDRRTWFSDIPKRAGVANKTTTYPVYYRITTGDETSAYRTIYPSVEGGLIPSKIITHPTTKLDIVKTRKDTYVNAIKDGGRCEHGEILFETDKNKLKTSGVSWGNLKINAKNGDTYVYYYCKGDEGYSDTEVYCLIVPVLEKTGEVKVPPTIKTNLVYNGEYQELVTDGIDQTFKKILYKQKDGQWTDEIPVAKDAGEYIVHYKSDVSNFIDWFGLFDREHELTVRIERAPINGIVTQCYDYDGNEHYALVKTNIMDLEYDGNNIYIPGLEYVNGTISATEVGTYTITFKPDANHCWSDGSTSPLPFEWFIDPVPVGNIYPVSCQCDHIHESNEGNLYFGLKYNGEIQYIINEEDLNNSGYVLSDGTISGSEVREYSFTIKPDRNHCWNSEYTESDKTIYWHICN